MKKDVLVRPFAPEQVRTRPGQGGKSYTYVETHAVIARLNEAADFDWSFEVVKHEVLADEVIVLGKLSIDGVTKMAFGGSSVTRDGSGKEQSLADDLKAAASKAPRSEERRSPRVDDRLTSRQLAAIQAACRRKGWSSDHLSALVDERFGKGTPQMLSRSEASALLSDLTGANGH